MNVLKKGKVGFFAMALLSVMAFSQVKAQDAEITNDNLRRYALLNEVVDIMKSDIKSKTSEMVKNQDGMTGKRFNELRKSMEGAKEWEIKFMDLIAKKKADGIDAIKTANQVLASKMVGGKMYKKIKNELKTNDELKARYEAIAAKLKPEAAE